MTISVERHSLSYIGLAKASTEYYNLYKLIKLEMSVCNFKFTAFQ